ncbi:hypothetical protein [Paraburkholderia ferrariae]|nr:hypothetical protein [Paraburkholderia ferrariae]
MTVYLLDHERCVEGIATPREKEARLRWKALLRAAAAIDSGPDDNFR